MQHRREHNIKPLGGSVLLAIAYSGLLYYLRTLTGANTLDGIIGVLLGLYICSHPAANMLDALFFERRFQRQGSSRWSGISWLALNLLVLLVGWLVITIGATQLTARAA